MRSATLPAARLRRRSLVALLAIAALAGARCGGGTDAADPPLDAATADVASVRDAAGPDGAGPDAAGPDTAALDTAAPDTAGPETAVSDAGGAPDVAPLDTIPVADVPQDAAPETAGFDPARWKVGTVIDTCAGGLLASVPTPYGDLLVARLEGSHEEMGYQYGCLLGQHIVDLWWSFMTSLAEEDASIATPADADLLLGVLLDLAWRRMDNFVPQRFLDQFDAVGRGAADAGVDCDCSAADGVGQLVGRMITMLEVSQTRAYESGIDEAIDFVTTGASQPFRDYFAGPQGASLDGAAASLDDAPPAAGDAPWGPRRRSRPFLSTCSFFAVWGDRTTDGHLIASRVLDFDRDTGIAAHKLVAVYVPDEGHAYATVGYAGVPMAGLSETGIAVGLVGATSALERMDAAPGLLRIRETLEVAGGFEEAAALVTAAPAAVGGNVLAAWGDPAGGGAGARAVAAEMNAAFTATFTGATAPSCGHAAEVFAYGEDGALLQRWTDADPGVVNPEGEACEIDRDGVPRTFAVDDAGDVVLVGGLPTADPDGQPLPVGKPLPCALFRGDEAMGRAVRRWQSACNGPWRGDGSGLMTTSGSYRNRYTVMHDMIVAYETGAPYELDGVVLIPDGGGVPTPIGLPEGGRIAAAAAEPSNILSVVYDATALELLVSYESGTGETWRPASANEYVHLRLRDLLWPE